MSFAAPARRAFSLIELVIVVVIIGIIAAIAIPRMSRGAAAATDASLASSLRTMRNSIDLFYTEHANTYPTVASFVNQMTLFTDEPGTGTSATKDSTFYFGPYLRVIPPAPVGAKKGKSGIAAVDGPTIGWLYTETTGKFTVNCTTEADVSGKLYLNY